MVYYSYNSNSSSGYDFSRLFNPAQHNLGSSVGVSLNGLGSSHSLVLDSEKGELVKSHSSIGKKGVPEAKALAALKTHREAERRRRERINDHLSTLRDLVSCPVKMDKATILAEVITQMKELKKNAVEASKGFLVPTDADEVKVEPYNDEGGEGSTSYRASVCCDYRPELLADLRQTLDALRMPLVRAEISTLGCRVKNVFVYTCCERDNINIEECQPLASTVHQALSSVLYKSSNSLRMSLPSKRQRRLCVIETSTSSYNHGSYSC